MYTRVCVARDPTLTKLRGRATSLLVFDEMRVHQRRKEQRGVFIRARQSLVEHDVPKTVLALRTRRVEGLGQPRTIVRRQFKEIDLEGTLVRLPGRQGRGPCGVSWAGERAEDATVREVHVEFWSVDERLARDHHPTERFSVRGQAGITPQALRGFHSLEIDLGREVFANGLRSSGRAVGGPGSFIAGW